MDDNNKYNKSRNYDLDNFDDEVAFPARRNNVPEQPADDYGDSFEEDIKFAPNFDEDSVQMPETDFEEDSNTPVKMPAERDNSTQAPDYGDNFDSQTGEQVTKVTKDYQYDLSSDDKGNYYTKSTIHPKRKKVVKKKKRTNRNMAVIFTIAAIICLIIAIVFAFTQCNSQKKDDKATTSPSTQQITTAQPTTEYGDDNYVPDYTDAPAYEPETEYQPETETPVQTEPQTEYQPATEAPQSSESSSPESSQSSYEPEPAQSSQEDSGDEPDEPYVEEN